LESLIATLNSNNDRTINTDYDALNQKTEVRLPAVNYYLTSPDANTHYSGIARPTTDYTYNAFGELTSQSVLRNPVLGDRLVSYFGYDQLGRRTDQIDGLGYYTKTSYDDLGRITQFVQYAKALGTIPVSLPDFRTLTPPPTTSAGALDPLGYDRVARYTYDRLDRQISQTRVGALYAQHNSTGGITSGLIGDLTSTTRYDAVGNVIATTDAGGNTTHSYFDALGRLTAVVSPQQGSSGRLTENFYDLLGNQVLSRRYINGAANITDTSYTRGAASGDDQSTYQRFDALGRAIEVIDAEGHSTFNSYDAYGHVARTWQTQTDTVSGASAQRQRVAIFRYDRTGQQLSATNITRNPLVSGYTVQSQSATFNTFGEQTGRGLFVNGVGSYTEYADYDAAGRLWQTNTGGVNKVYRYDLQGHTTAEILTPSVATALGQNQTFVRLGAPADVASITSGIVTETVYDRLGRVISVREPRYTVAAQTADGSGLVQITNQPSLQYGTFTNALYIDRNIPGEPRDGLEHVGTLSWSSLSAYGTGAVTVIINYLDEDGVERTHVQSANEDGNSGDTGATIRWTELDTEAHAVAHINYVEVTKVVGNTTLTVRSSRTSVGTELTIDPAAGLSLGSLQLIGSTVQPTLTANTATAYTVSFAGIADGTYEYQVRISDSFTSALGGSATPSLNPETGVFDLYRGRITIVNGQATALEALDTAPSYQTIRSQTLDRWGNTLSSIDPRDASLVTRYRYDDHNRLLRADNPDVRVYADDGTVQTLTTSTEAYYDSTDRQIGSLDENRGLRRQFYDAAGAVIDERRADNSQILHNFDGLGRQTSSVNGNGAITRYNYDHLNRLIRQETLGYSQSRYASYGYDEVGNRTVSRNEAGEVTYDRYDTQGHRVAALTPLAGGDVNSVYQRTYSYDAQGNKISETDGLGGTQTWRYDAYGRVQRYTDLGGFATTSSYDAYGRLSQQSRTTGAELHYSYYENGRLKDIDSSGNTYTDLSTGVVLISVGTRHQHFEYDLAGNRTREQFDDGAQDTRTTYDERGRISQVRDRGFRVEYGYDAVGNRRRIYGQYLNTPGQATPQVQNFWYLYDAENRITLSQGVLINGALTIRAQSGSTAAQGVQLSYDAAGNRTEARQFDGTTDGRRSYRYDANNRITDSYYSANTQTSPSSPGRLTSHRDYDLAGRVTRYYDYGIVTRTGFERDAPTLQHTTIKDYRYNLNGQVLRQDQYDRTTTNGNVGPQVLQAQIRYSSLSDPGATDAGYYDAAGNLTQYQLQNYNGTTYTNTYAYTYLAIGGSYRESRIAGSNSNGIFLPGNSLTFYDINGQLSEVNLSSEHLTRTYATDTQGLIHRRTDTPLNQPSKTQNYYYVDGNAIGSSGALTTADFDYNYTPVSEQYPASTPGRYVVQADNETLRSVSLAVFGDETLWYLIADANGLSGTGDEALTVGQSLTLPNQITNLRNAADTFKPYNPNAIRGDTTPVLQAAPPAPQRSNIVAAIIIAVVAVVVSVQTKGATTGFFANLFNEGLAANAAAGAVAGAAGSIASQAVAIGLGVQDDFSFAGLATATIGGAVGGAFGGGGQLGERIGNAVASNALTQGVNVALGLQDRFSFAALATSAVFAGIEFEAERNIPGFERFTDNGLQTSGFNDPVAIAGVTAKNFVQGVITQRVRGLFEGGGRINYATIAADSFGNALGNAVVGEIQFQGQRGAFTIGPAGLRRSLGQ